MIPGKLLVRTLPVEHDLDADPPGLFEHTPLGEDRRRAERLVLMPGDVHGAFEHVLRSWEDEVGLGVGMRNDRIHKRLLVDAFFGVARRDRIYLWATVSRP